MLGDVLFVPIRSLGPVKDLSCSFLAVGGRLTMDIGLRTGAGVVLALWPPSASDTNRFSSSGSPAAAALPEVALRKAETEIG